MQDTWICNYSFRSYLAREDSHSTEKLHVTLLQILNDLRMQMHTQSISVSRICRLPPWQVLFIWCITPMKCFLKFIDYGFVRIDAWTKSTRSVGFSKKVCVKPLCSSYEVVPTARTRPASLSPDQLILGTTHSWMC